MLSTLYMTIICRAIGISAKDSLLQQDAYKNQFQYDVSLFQIFSGNADNNTVVTNELKPALKAKYVRIKPKAWYRWIKIRVELYGCVAGWCVN